jgi:hypothetical protein
MPLSRNDAGPARVGARLGSFLLHRSGSEVNPRHCHEVEREMNHIPELVLGGLAMNPEGNGPNHQCGSR